MIDYSKRLKEFVWYHVHGDGDCNGQVLRVCAEMLNYNAQDKFDLAYFYSITYCCASALFLMQNRELILKDHKAFAERFKSKLVFQSDRKYVRMLNNFAGVLSTWVNLLYNRAHEFNDKFISGNVINTKKALQNVEKWFFFSRFSAYLFVETYCDILQASGSRADGLEYEGDSMTFAGGLYYCFGMDSEAEYVQKHHKLATDRETFEALIHEVQEEVKAAGGDDNITKLETSLCAYEKFFKGTRYNGYYADRQLEEVVKMIKEPLFKSACDIVLKARRMAIPTVYLGERNGWNGIRKEAKKSYRENGRISYCPY